MTPVDTLIHAKWVIPMDAPNAILCDHTVAIKQQRIVEVLPTALALKKYTAPQQFSLNRHALIPGLINSHTHLSMNLLRGLADDLSLMTWLNEHIWPAEKAWVSPDFVRAGSCLAMAEMIKAGVTCFNDMYFFPEVTAEVATQIGMRGSVGAALMGFPTAWAKDDDDALAKGLNMHERYRGSDLITVTLAPHAIYTVPEESLRKVAATAEKYDLRINIHVHETADEVNNSIKQHGLRPVKRLTDYGVNQHRMIAVHLTQTNEEDIELLAASGASIVHCPESNMKLASGYCPVSTLLKTGINVALGTDGAASNNDLSLLGEIRSAALLGKLMTQDPEAISAFTALQMATINGAKALGLADQTGSITAGKYADLVAMDLHCLNTVPVYNPISQIVYAASRDQVTDVWIAGRPVLTNKALTTVDEQELFNLVDRWQLKIRH